MLKDFFPKLAHPGIVPSNSSEKKASQKCNLITKPLWSKVLMILDHWLSWLRLCLPLVYKFFLRKYLWFWELNSKAASLFRSLADVLGSSPQKHTYGGIDYGHSS